MTVWRSEDGERVGHLEAAAPKPEHACGPTTGAGDGAAQRERLDHVAADEDPLEVRGRHPVAEARRVQVTQLGDRELGRRESEANVRGPTICSRRSLMRRRPCWWTTGTPSS
jgi:hypothetical protein